MRDVLTYYDNPKATPAIERFLEITVYEFECWKIIGRKFENISDRASYLRAGAAEKLLEHSLAVKRVD